MINLSEVCSYISDLLNSNANPVDFLYDVQAVGYHADTVYDKEKGKNLIRVFVSTFGGEFNPVPNLGQATYTIPVTFYFPVRFKENFFALDGYLHHELVGKSISSFNAVSNLSIATYGEIQDLDFKEFKAWADNLYKKPIEVMEKYMSMTVNLYLTTISYKYKFGNAATAKLYFTANKVTFYNELMPEGLRTFYGISTGITKIVSAVEYQQVIIGDSYYYIVAGSSNVYTEGNNAMEKILNIIVTQSASATFNIPLVFAQGSFQRMSQAQDEQIIGTNESDGLPFSSSFGAAFSIYIEDSPECFYVLKKWGDGNTNEVAFFLEIAIGEVTIQKPVYIASGNLSLNKGQPMVFSLSFSKRTETNGL